MTPNRHPVADQDRSRMKPHCLAGKERKVRGSIGARDRLVE